MKKIAVSVMALLVAAAGAQAQKKTPLERFGETDLPLIRTKVRFTTLIVLPDGEEIADVICGDKDYWVIEGKDSIVYVKPAKERARTNVNVISKSKTVYSFLVQEISSPSNPNQQPDLKVLLGGDELLKVKKDKENLEEALSRSERSLSELKAKNHELKAKPEGETPKKKDDAESSGGIFSLRDGVGRATLPLTISKPEAEVSASSSAPALSASVSEEKGYTPVDEKPIASSWVVKPKEGFVHKSGRFLGRIFKKIGQALHPY